MFFKKILPIILFVSLLSGSLIQPGFADQQSKSVAKGLRGPSDIITVCIDITCDYHSIQEAINNAKPNDTILLSDETYQETITISETLTIRGEGAENTIIQAASGPPPLANSRVITVTSGVSVVLESVAVQYGFANGSGLDGYGGGILNQGNLTIRDTLVVTNTARFGGGIANYAASGQAQLTIEGSEIRNNRANDTGGGINNTTTQGLASTILTDSLVNENEAFTLGAGIVNSAEQNNASSVFTVTHSTLTMNASDDNGGGAVNQADNDGTAKLIVINSTLSGNSAESDGDGFYSIAGTGEATAAFTQTTIYDGGLHLENGTTTLAQSIVAGASGDECTNVSGTLIDAGYNLAEDNTCGFSIVGNPRLEALADNGGATPTHALRSSSPALERIPANQCSSNLDQRGLPRPFGTGCDIGAFELSSLNVEVEQTVDKTNVTPGQMITFTVEVDSIGPGLTEGTLTADLPEEVTLTGAIQLDPPSAGVIGTPPTLAHSMLITSNQQVILTMQAEISLGLPEGTQLVNFIEFDSAEITSPIVTSTTLNIINAGPVALDDGGEAFTTTSNQVFTTGNVLENDSDPNNDPISVHGIFDPNEPLGEVTNNGDGTFTYDPDGKFDELLPGQIAYDTFQYVITDGKGGLPAPATVTITIEKGYNLIYLPVVTR